MSARPRTHNSDGRRARGNSNGDLRGSTETRRRRRAYLLETYAADVKLVRVTFKDGQVIHSDQGLTYWQEMTLFDVDQPWLNVESAVEVPTARCYRCGMLLHEGNLTVDQIKPKALGGTYRRENIRPACPKDNSATGAALAAAIRRGEVKVPKSARRR